MATITETKTKEYPGVGSAPTIDSTIWTAGNVYSVKLFDASVPSYTTYTSEANNDNLDDVPLMPVPIGVNDYLYIGGELPFNWILFTISQYGGGTYTTDWQYWDGYGWRAIISLFDTVADLGHFRSGRSVIFTTLLTGPYTWKASTIDSVDAFWVRCRCITTGSGYIQPLGARIYIRYISQSFEEDLSETFEMSESLVASLSSPLSLSETLEMSESLSSAMSLNQELFEEMLFGNDEELIQFAGDYWLDLSEVFDIYDSEELIFDWFIYLSEEMEISEKIEFLISLIFGETLDIEDALNIVAALAIRLSEQMDIEDEPAFYMIIGSQIEGLRRIVDILADPSKYLEPWMPYIAIGTSNVIEEEANLTRLFNEVYRKRGRVVVKENTYFVRAEFGQDEPIDDITVFEVGIFSAEEDGVMGKRWVLPTGMIKDGIDEIVVECAVSFVHGTMETLAIGVSDFDKLVDNLLMSEKIELVLSGPLE